MSVINTLFFELIRVAIGTQGSLSRLPSEAEWKALFRMAEKQSLVGICFAGLQHLGADADDGFEKIGMSEMQYLNWMSASATVQERNETVNRQCVELQERLRADGIRNFIMKGQGNAALYGGLALLRQSGDIDVYLEGGLDKVLSYAKTVGETTEVNELEMHVKVYDDTEVEFHYRPFIMRNPFKNGKLQSFFRNQEEACFANRVALPNEDDICAPTVEFNLIHQLAHIRLHLFTEGIGLRQLMDYYFVLKASEDVDAAVVRNAVKDLDLQRFASALIWVLQHVFGMDGSDFVVLGVEANEADGKFLLEQVMEGGNFGRYNQNQNNRKQKAGYSFWALFVRNLKLSRFDRADWFWGPLWRGYHFLWRKCKNKELNTA